MGSPQLMTASATKLRGSHSYRPRPIPALEAFTLPTTRAWMNLRNLLSLPFNLLSVLVGKSPVPAAVNSTRAASAMVLDPGKMNVLHGPLQPHTQPGDSTHPTGYLRDGYCWGSDMDAGQHYIGGVVTGDFLQFSKERGNDLMTRRGGFPGLTEGCRWCLCVDRWKEALLASATRGDSVVPKVDLSSTAFDALHKVSMEDLRRFEWTGER